MAAGGGMGVLPASLACGVFVLMRDGFVFWLGYKYGVELLDKPWARRIVRRELVEKFRDRVQKNEKAVVFSGRFMPGLRGPVFFAAGTARVSPISFVVVDTFAALISVPIWVWLGFMFADNYDQLTAAARHFRVGLLGTAAVVLLVVLFRILRKRRAAGQPRP
jgi:membrane protein DedA with SNARE-associated domain